MFQGVREYCEIPIPGEFVRLKNAISAKILTEEYPNAKYVIVDSIKNEGCYTVLRKTNDINFNVFLGKPGITFIHKEGFIMEIRKENIDILEVLK